MMCQAVAIPKPSRGGQKNLCEGRGWTHERQSEWEETLPVVQGGYRTQRPLATAPLFRYPRQQRPGAPPSQEMRAFWGRTHKPLPLSDAHSIFVDGVSKSLTHSARG